MIIIIIIIIIIMTTTTIMLFSFSQPAVFIKISNLPVLSYS